jgi:hypothetical protein
MRIFARTAVFSFGLAVAMGVAAEATPLASDRDMVTGISVTEADCRAQNGRLWVKVENRGFCVRFWLSTFGGNKDEALVAFDGDIGGRIDGKLQLLEQARSITDESLQKKAWFGSAFFKGPYFLIARPGTFGSSGNHVKDRRTLLEIRIASATLDALKRHYRFKRFHLVGQSGGGHTVAGLVQSRSDIGCAAIASAPISLRSSQRDRGHPIFGKDRFYDPIDHVNAMKQRPDLRLFVVSDRKDKLVSYRSQLEFVERVKAHNLPITHVTGTATDKDSHGLFAYGHQLADNCAHDAWEAEEVERAWSVSKDTTTIAVLEEFVRNYGDSHYATLARARMEELRKSHAAAQTTVPPGLDAVPRPPSASSGVVAPPSPYPLQLAAPASQPKRSDRFGQPRAQSDTAQRTHSPDSGPAAPVAQKVVLYDEDPSDPRGRQFVGSVIWRTEPIKARGNQKADIALRADIDIPERRFKMSMSFRRNTDSSLSASHTAELIFIQPQDFSSGLDKAPFILTESNEHGRGVLSSHMVKVADGFFLVGSSNDRARNSQLLKESLWFNVPLVYGNKAGAKIAIEKGPSGERAFKDAFAAWGE